MAPNAKLKKLISLSLLIVALGIVYMLAAHPRFFAATSGQANNSERKVLYWYDAMNPQRTYDKPGKAPDGMDLVPKYADGDEGRLNNMPVGTVKISPENQQVIGVQTTVVRHEALIRTLRTVTTCEFVEANHSRRFNASLATAAGSVSGGMNSGSDRPHLSLTG